MKLDSPIFDRIRVKPDKDRRRKRTATACDWPGCGRAATHRAPKGRSHEDEYWRYCLDHVRMYNQSYNYFAGMPDEAVAAYQKEAVTGHRPTWQLGFNAARRAGGPSQGRAGPGFTIRGLEDPFGLFEGSDARRGEPDTPGNRLIRNAERKALSVLGLEIEAGKSEIKSRFKELVKRHHPDVNGGDRSTEDRLKDVIQAYNYLKSAGFC
jgi:curved DNA-binding protein CbpA